MGDLDSDGQVIEWPEPVLVRMHRRNLLGDVFGECGSLRPSGSTGRVGSTAEVLHESMRAIQEAGCGVVVYLRPEGAGDDLAQRLLRIRRPTTDPDEPNLTGMTAAITPGGAQPMNEREFGIGCQILRDLGVCRLRLLTNHTTKWPGIEAFGIEIVDRVPIGNLE